MRDHLRQLLTAGVSLGVGLAAGLSISSSRSPAPVARVEAENSSAIVEPSHRSWGFSRPATVARPRTDPLEAFRSLQQASGRPDLAALLSAIPAMSVAQCEETVRLLRGQRTLEQHEQVALFKALAKQWAALDPESAFAHALRYKESDLQQALGSEALRQLALVDAEAALAKIATAKTREERTRVAVWAINAVAPVNPALAAERLPTLKEVVRNEDLYRNVAREYARQSPSAALAWAQQLTAENLRREATRHAWGGWADVAPDQAALAATQSPTPLDHGIYQSIVWGWSRNDPAAALNWIQTLDKKLGPQLAGDIVVDFQKMPAESYAAILAAPGSDAIKGRLAGRVANEMARIDTDGALQWALALPEGAARSSALRPVMQALSASDPEAAAKQIVNLPIEKGREDFMRMAIHSWSEQNPDAAFSFVQTLPAEAERDAAAAHAIRAIAGEQPDKAMQWLATLQNPTALQKTGADIVGALVRHNPQYAIQLAGQLPPESQPNAYHNLVRGWAFEKEQAAGEWINTLPLGPGRDAAVKAYVSVIDGMDAGRATQWAQSISDPEHRIEATFEAFNRWSRENPAAAQEWLNANQGTLNAAPIFQKQIEERSRERKK